MIFMGKEELAVRRTRMPGPIVAVGREASDCVKPRGADSGEVKSLLRPHGRTVAGEDSTFAL
jgi:hypothetical protein